MCEQPHQSLSLCFDFKNHPLPYQCMCPYRHEQSHQSLSVCLSFKNDLRLHQCQGSYTCDQPYQFHLFIYVWSVYTKVYVLHQCSVSYTYYRLYPFHRPKCMCALIFICFINAGVHICIFSLFSFTGSDSRIWFFKHSSDSLCPSSWNEHSYV